MYLWYPAGAREPEILPELLTQELVIGLVEGR
jgi:thiol:disulfide interchange protein DsbD